MVCSQWLRLAWDGTDLIWKGGQGDTQAILHSRLHPSRHGEAESLQEGREEQEEFHLGQVLPKTHSLTCGNGGLSYGGAFLMFNYIHV